ncbi:MAG: Gfo/Idh/MocA family oxidoreductase [Bryobacterales bacterium]|nr:Gfo/Idh/MocA family oxidoreductase [Bryobacterales bacterium]
MATAFLIVPRHVLGGRGFLAPSDKITLASIGMGRQGMAVTMDLLARPDIQVIAVCDCNEASKDYIEYGANALLVAARKLLGPGYESWAEDLASPGFVQLTHSFRSSLGMGGREPARRLVEAYYASRQKSGSWRGCTAYRDFRDLLEKEKDLDAVYVATPDHWHAPISIAAMRKGKHVLCQKPMAHSIGEARRMAQVARETKVATGLPVNNPTSEATRLISEWIHDGAIGRVREVHNWSSRPYWPQGVDRPREAMPAPPGLDWDLWLGPAPWRPFHKAYHPFVWRGWYDFGCGSFGDMGCYSFAGLFKILDLTPPVAAEASTTEVHEETYPLASVVHLDFPARGDRGPLRVVWYDGGLRPPRPAGLREQDERRFRSGQEGVMYVGDKGIIIGGFNGDNPRVYPESQKYQAPPRPPAAGVRDRAIDQWIAACRGGPPSATNFESQAAVTEAFLLGCLAQRLPGERLEWDAAAMRVTNSERANRYVDPPYRSEYSS